VALLLDDEPSQAPAKRWWGIRVCQDSPGHELDGHELVVSELVEGAEAHGRIMERAWVRQGLSLLLWGDGDRVATRGRSPRLRLPWLVIRERG